MGNTEWNTKTTFSLTFRPEGKVFTLVVFGCTLPLLSD